MSSRKFQGVSDQVVGDLVQNSDVESSIPFEKEYYCSAVFGWAPWEETKSTRAQFDYS